MLIRVLVLAVLAGVALAEDAEQVCCAPDIVIIIDRLYVTKSNYNETVRPTLVGFFDALDSCVDVRAAFLEYASSVHIRSTLRDRSNDLDELRGYVHRFRPGSSTLGKKSMLTDALDGVDSQLFTLRNGRRQNKPAFVFLFLGKNPTNVNTAMVQSQLMRRDGVTFFVFGLGKSYSENVVISLAGSPQNYFSIDTMGDFSKALTMLVCSSNAHSLGMTPGELPKPKQVEAKQNMPQVEAESEMPKLNLPKIKNPVQKPKVTLPKQPESRVFEPAKSESAIFEEEKDSLEETLSEEMQQKPHMNMQPNIRSRFDGSKLKPKQLLRKDPGSDRVHVKTRSRSSTRRKKTALCMALGHRKGIINIPDPENFHNYIKCKFHGSNGVTSTLEQCGQGRIFNADAMECVLEGPYEGADFCRHEQVAANGCYPSMFECSKYFLCSHGVSYAKCCPQGHRFDQQKCGCVLDLKCRTHCRLSRERTRYGVLAPDVTTCVDNYNNTLRRHPGRPDLYEVVENAGTPEQRFFTVPCAHGSAFQVASCRCEHLTYARAQPENIVSKASYVKSKQCKVYLPFNNNFQDHSNNKFAVYKHGSVFLNKVNDSVTGTGRSMLVNNGYLEIPGLAGIDLSNKASWCMFYRCQQMKNKFTCAKSGGLLSNSKDSFGSSYTIVLASKFRDQVVARVRLNSPVESTITTNASVNSVSGWHHVCVVHNGIELELYTNGVSVSRKEAIGNIAIANFPYLIGTDHRYGSFVGSIDDVLMCEHAMTPEEVKAHYDGNVQFLVSKGLIPPQ